MIDLFLRIWFSQACTTHISGKKRSGKNKTELGGLLHKLLGDDHDHGYKKVQLNYTNEENYYIIAALSLFYY